MAHRRRLLLVLPALLAVGLFAATSVAEPPAKPASDEEASSQDNAAGKPLTVEDARRQAKLLQRTYVTTLQMMHRRYFDEDERHPIPARTLEEVFKDVDHGTQRTTGWIAVNTPAMNVDHEPEPGFETDAVAALTGGEKEFERVEDGTYRRAGVVPLAGGCLKCHVSGLTKSVSTPRVAAFVIAIPVQEK